MTSFPNIPDDTIHVELKSLLTEAIALKDRDPEKSLEFLSLGIERAGESGNVEMQAEFLLERSDWFDQMERNPERVQDDLNSIERLIDQLPQFSADILRIRAKCVRGLFAEHLGQFVQARELDIEALKLAQKLNHRAYEARIRVNFGLLMQEAFGDFDTSIGQFKEALKLADKFSERYGSVCFNLANAAYQLGDYTTAWEYLQETFQCHSTNEGRWSLRYGLASRLCEVEDKLDEALVWANRAIDHAQRQRYPLYLWGSFWGRGTVFSRMGTHPDAIKDFEKVLEYARKDSERCATHAYLASLFAQVSKSETRDQTRRENAERAREHLQISEKIFESIGGIQHLSLAYIAQAKANMGDGVGAYSALDKSIKMQNKLCSPKTRNEISSIRLLMKIEQEKYERQMEKMKREQLEKDFANASIHLATQTELLGNFRNRLRQIVREIDEPLMALKRIKEELKTLPCESVDWTKFEIEFTSIHPEFKAKLMEQYPDLTKQEVKMCQLARLGLKNIEMAQLLCLSERSVENHRFNLRKKLGLRTEQKLSEFLATIR